MSEKKTVNASFKGREIETKSDGKVKRFVNPVTESTDGIELFTQQFRYYSKVSNASRRTHAITQYLYNGDLGVSMAELFDPKELDVINSMVTTIDKACYIMSENAPLSVYNQLVTRNEYVYQRCMSTFEHIEDQNKSDDTKRLAVLNLLSDTIVNIDQALYDINNLLCPDTENSMAIVIRPALRNTSENMLMLRDYIETRVRRS